MLVVCVSTMDARTEVLGATYVNKIHERLHGVGSIAKKTG
jgi:hypothetical protein